MAKKEKEKDYRISADKLIEHYKNRPIINLCLSADIALGGGIPLGSTVVMSGDPGLGKTTLALQYAANAQNLFDSKVFFFPIEGRLTDHVLEQIQGIKTSEEHFEVVMPPAIYNDDGEVAGHIKWSGEQWWDAIGETIEENRRCVIIVDCVSNMSSEKEQSEGMGHQGRGDRNKLESEFCRKYGDLIVSHEITFILLAQIMANTSGYGKTKLPKIGNSFKHQADVFLLGKKFEKWPEKDGRILGQDIIFIADKNAMGPPYVEVNVPLRYGYGVDNLKDMITQALNWDIIKKGGAWYTLPFFEEEEGIFAYDPEAESPVKLQGEASVRNWFLMNPEEAQLVESKVREMIFG